MRREVRPIYQNRLLTWSFVLIMLLTPIVSACHRGRPTTTPSSPTPASAGTADPVALATGEGATPAPTSAIPTPTRAPLPPLVVQVTPAVGEEFPLAAPLSVTFDQPMDPGSTSAAFSIEPKVKGEVKVDGDTLVFTPSEQLRRAAQYIVTVNDTAASTIGLKLAEPVSFRVSTVGYLQVTNTQPADKTEDVPVDSKIVVAFNRPVVPLTGIADQAGLPDPLIITPTVAGKGEWLNTGIYQFTAASGLAASTDYTVTVKAGLKDTTGGLLADSHTFGFRTTDPTVISWLPEETRNVKISTVITVTFSMPMDPASTEAAFTLFNEAQQQVDGTFTWSEDHTALGFKPTRALAFGTTYLAAVADTASPANGSGRLRGEASRSFTTVSLPEIVRTEPRQGVTNADPFGGVTFEFASPMDPSSFVSGTYTIQPTPTRVYTSYNEYDSTFYLQFDRLPTTAYTVTLSPRLADPYGNTLGEAYVLHFATRDYDPMLQFNSPGQVGTFNAYTNTQAFVTYRNVPEVDFSLYAVPAADFIALTGRDYWDKWNNYSPSKANLLREWAEQTDAKRNVSALLRVGLVGEDGTQLPPGMYYLRLYGKAGTAQLGETYRQLLARTDLNVTLKSESPSAGSPLGGALAWVTDLKSGLPVADVKVRFTDGDKLDLEATTDQDGIARVTFDQPHRSWDPLVALANGADGQFGVASNNWEDGISPWNFNLPGGGSTQAYMGYVYTDRPIYRPGQTVYWKAVIRRDDDAIYSLPAPGMPVTVTIRDDQGNELSKQDMTLDPMGTVNGQFVLGADASLGYYNVSIDLIEGGTPDQEQISYGVGFQVAEYRKPEYEISATTARPEYIQGEQISVTVQANYFFGGPVKDGKVHWVLLSNDYSFGWTGKGNYSFTDWDWYNQQSTMGFGGSLSEGDGQTDAQGRYTFVVPADIAKFSQSQRFTFDITILDVNNQTVSTQANAVVHKGAFYIGLHPQSYVSTTDDESLVDVITVDPQSNVVPNTTVTAVVNQVTWYSVREQLEDGRYYWNTKARETPVFTQTVTTSITGTAVMSWTPKQGGEYKVVATGRDKAGHAIRSAAYIWVSGSSYVNWRQENNDRIQLVADKDTYVVGDTAELLIASPYQTPVKALLSIERNHIISYKIIDIQGNSQTLRVPITAGYAPDVFVSIMLVKGMDETSPAPSFKMGLAQLRVSVADKELQVILIPQGAGGGAGTVRVAPRNTVTWTVQTLNAAGKPVQAEVSLALIDKSILTLASDQSGTLMDRFYSQRALGVRTASTLVVNVDRLVAQLSQGGKGGGGGGGGQGLSVRSEFPDIAYWNANVKTGADGKAQVAVTLPDNLTTWTMDARAVTADTLVGQKQADIIATKDLLVRPVLPRFFVEKDQVEIAAVIHNNTKNAMDVTLDLQATGLALPDKTQSVVSVPAQSTYKATWPVSVLANIDQVKVQMSARGATLSDAVAITLPVEHYTTPEVTGTSGQVALGENRLELVRLPENADPQRGGLDVQLEPSLAAGMTGGLTYLEHYPYECVEQTMSRFLPNVISYQALKKLAISRPDLETRLPQEVGVGLQRIYTRQHIDGGWGWWQNDESNAAVSAYVIFGLAKARAAGFAVDKDIMDRGVSYLKSTLKGTSDLNDWELNRQAFAVYALAEAGDMEPNRAGGLYEVREKLSLYARGYLALTFGLIDDPASPGRISTLLADLTSKAIVSATSTHWEEDWADYWNMNTDTRSTAIILDVLSQFDAQNSLAPNAVRWLMTARKADRWETTQENAWAIIALTDWMATTGELEGNYSWQVLLNDATLGDGTVTPATVDRPIDLTAGIAQLLVDQTNSLVIQRAQTGSETGKGQLYYTLHLKTYEPVEELKPLDRGVVVSREYRLADCEDAAAARGDDQSCPTITQARVGDVINVKLDIVVPHAVQYLVVEDPLPAGTEGIDTSLLTTSSTAQGPEIKIQPDGSKQDSQLRWSWWWTPTHTDMRDEKVALFATSLAPGAYEFTYQIRASLPGHFLTLPPTGYEMYFPEVWGRGAGSVFTVTE